MKKLVVREFEVDEDSGQLEKGEGYSYFQDPETGKFYQPKVEFVVKGEDLSDLFVEA